MLKRDNRKNSNKVKRKIVSVVSGLVIIFGSYFVTNGYTGIDSNKINDAIGLSEYLSIFKSTEYTKEAKSEEIQALIDSVETSDQICFDYSRDEWEKPAKKFDGQSIRNYSISISDNLVSDGDYNFDYIDPYTEKSIHEIAAIDYDHIIPISYANSQGGCNWNESKKKEFTFDIETGVNTHQRENRRKGADGPSSYMPEKNKEEYAYTWLVIADKYDIPLKKEDMAVIQEVLSESDSVEVINKYN